jgi:NitT/TauT family transport system substrate-binding protein
MGAFSECSLRGRRPSILLPNLRREWISEKKKSISELILEFESKMRIAARRAIRYGGVAKSPRIEGFCNRLLRRHEPMKMRFISALVALLLSGMVCQAGDKVTVMFPASLGLSNVSAFQIARYKNYYGDAGLEVEFLPGQGGVYAGREVGEGKADFGVVFGDTAIVLRSQGLPLKMVALLGGQSPMVLAANTLSGIRNLKDLKGKSISILSREDSTYYILLAALASVNLKESDVDIRALGATGVARDFIRGDVQVCACIPEWIVAAKDAGVKMNLIRVSDYLPSLAQSIVTSDQYISAHPDAVRRFVQASLKAFVDLRDDPVATTKIYVMAVPEHHGQESTLARIYDYYKASWSGQTIAGSIDARKIEKLQNIYYDLHIISKKSPPLRIFANSFIHGADRKALSD